MPGLCDSAHRMMWIVVRVDLLISPDTGLLHVVHLLGTPVIGLFGAQESRPVGPPRQFGELAIDRYIEPGAIPEPTKYDTKHGRME